MMFPKESTPFERRIMASAFLADAVKGNAADYVFPIETGKFSVLGGEVKEVHSGVFISDEALESLVMMLCIAKGIRAVPSEYVKISTEAAKYFHELCNYVVSFCREVDKNG